MELPRLGRIRIYPVKGLEPQEVEEVSFTPEGALLHDREFAFFDEGGKPVSGKREKKLFKVRSFVDFSEERFEFTVEGERFLFSFGEKEKVEELFSEYLGYRVFLKRRPEGGFPDDGRAKGPTLVFRESLLEVASWFGFSEEEARRRFRTNLELEGRPPFYEDALVGKVFSLGKAFFRGEGVSKRCPVPARHPETGEEFPGFVKRFVEKRRETLPPWSEPSLFKDTFYRFTLNTNLVKGTSLKVGDLLKE